jgi:hypothetical protein
LLRFTLVFERDAALYGETRLMPKAFAESLQFRSVAHRNHREASRTVVTLA